MASPPFNINQTSPQDTDIVSQFPANERSNRDIIESWLLVDHNTNGQHAKITMPQAAAPATPAASTAVLYMDTADQLKVKHASGTEEYVGVPVGAVFFVTGLAPVGYLELDGSAVSRTSFPKLFTYLGTFYGAGDGSTTFNIPDARGRVMAGLDLTGLRLTAAGLGVAATTGAVGGSQTYTLSTSEIPSHTHVNTLNDPGHTHTFSNSPLRAGSAFASGSSSGLADPGVVTINSASTGITINNVAVGGGGAHGNVQPTIVFRPVIKY